jgi:hypothetical protein
MAHFAEIDNEGVVLRVLVVPDAEEARGQEFLSNDLGLGGTWLKTSYNTIGGGHLLGGAPFRKNYAGIGYKYDADRDAFLPPKPFASWTLDEETCNWNPPTPYPSDEKPHEWDEATLSWKEIK